MVAFAIPQVEQWARFQASLQGPSEGNPFLDVQLAAAFTRGHRQVTVAGFCDGEGGIGCASYPTRSASRRTLRTAARTRWTA